MANKLFRDTAFGVAVHPHVNKPDSKFKPDNPEFKTKLRLEGTDAANMKALVDKAAQEAFDEFFATGEGKDMTPGERKKFSLYVPYEEEEDDQGDKTGSILFDFKQNAIIKIRSSGEVKHIVIGIYDGAGKPSNKPIWSGAEIRINYSMRPIPMKSLKQVGVRLDFGRVQYRKLASSTGGGGFGAVEGYEEDQSDGFGSVEGDAPSSGSGNDQTADY